MPIQVTGDGTHTIHSEAYNVPYHSIHGALQETEHVFIQAGLNHIGNRLSNIRILEFGFGTGLNVLATIVASKSNGYSINYQSIEAFPISQDQARELNYADYLSGINRSDLLYLHQCEWGNPVALNPNFRFTKHLVKMEDFKSEEKFDLIYFDAFAPNAQPELWQPQILRNMYDLLAEKGVLVTYCAKGQFKRDLKSVGFLVEPIPGPPRKREMTRAIKAQ